MSAGEETPAVLLMRDPAQMGFRRDVTVGELVALLLEYPEHMPVQVGVDKTLGVITDVWPVQGDVFGVSEPVLMIGERP